MQGRRSLTGEGGAALIEILVSAALLAVIMAGVLTSFDGAGHVSGQNKARAIAASLAQDDQERMRALPVADVSALATKASESTQRQVPEGSGIAYTVTSRAEWIADASASTSCAANGAAADYLKITTTVAAPAGVGIAPVRLTSTVTPPIGTFGPTQGSLAVSVVDRAGLPRAGLPVTITGPATRTRATDSLGCAFFGYQPVGSYSVGVAATGNVDQDGDATADEGATIAPQSVSVANVRYDRAGETTVTFRTQRLNATTGNPVLDGSGNQELRATSAAQVTFSHTGMTAPGRRYFPKVAGARLSSITASGLFPFTDSYSVFAGACDGARPAAPAIRLVAPGASGTLEVRVPAINVVVKDGASFVSGATVKIAPYNNDCAGTRTLGTTNANGVLDDADDPSAPFGAYTVCAEKGSKRRSATITHSSAAGTTGTVLSLANSQPACPS